MRDLPTITDQQRNASPAVTPQALAWHHGKLWMGSRDLSRIYVIDPLTWSVIEEHEPPGCPWAAVSDGETLWFTIGVGANDDRYVCRYKPGRSFAPESEWIACPEFAGSYLSYDGANLYLSQWYKHRILQLDRSGTILRTFDVEEEICGHTFVMASSTCCAEQKRAMNRGASRASTRARRLRWWKISHAFRLLAAPSRTMERDSGAIIARATRLCRSRCRARNVASIFGRDEIVWD
jgi:hypothetical protein